MNADENNKQVTNGCFRLTVFVALGQLMFIHPTEPFLAQQSEVQGKLLQSLCTTSCFLEQCHIFWREPQLMTRDSHGVTRTLARRLSNNTERQPWHDVTDKKLCL